MPSGNPDLPTFKLYVSREAEFSIPLPAAWETEETTSTERFHAVRFEGPDDRCTVVVQRFRTDVQVLERSEFDAVVEGVILGIEESTRPRTTKVIEREVKPVGDDGMAADFVMKNGDVVQRRRLLATGPVPPGALFLITASCEADRFLVHRRTFEEMLDGFAEMLGAHTP